MSDFDTMMAAFQRALHEHVGDCPVCAQASAALTYPEFFGYVAGRHSAIGGVS